MTADNPPHNQNDHMDGSARPCPPSPPPGCGPALEWYERPRQGTALAMALFLAIVGVPLTISYGLDWLTDPWGWALGIAVPVLLDWGAASGTLIAAGEDWVATSERSWVKTLELVAFRMTWSRSGFHFDLRDMDGRQVSLHLNHLGKNPRLRDLVFAGIRESARLPVLKTNRRARSLLRGTSLNHQPRKVWRRGTWRWE